MELNGRALRRLRQIVGNIARKLKPVQTDTEVSGPFERWVSTKRVDKKLYAYSFQFKTIKGDDVDCFLNPNPPGDENWLMISIKDKSDVQLTMTDDEINEFCEGWKGIHKLFKSEAYLCCHKDI